MRHPNLAKKKLNMIKSVNFISLYFAAIMANNCNVVSKDKCDKVIAATPTTLKF